MLISSRSPLTISMAWAAGNSTIMRKTKAIERKIIPCDAVMGSLATGRWWKTAHRAQPRTPIRTIPDAGIKSAMSPTPDDVGSGLRALRRLRCVRGGRCLRYPAHQVELGVRHHPREIRHPVRECEEAGDGADVP